MDKQPVQATESPPPTPVVESPQMLFASPTPEKAMEDSANEGCNI